MRVRHKIPSIFNLSMVDVLCCALGCVILLWLINLKIAKEHESRSADDKISTEKAKRDIEVNLASSERDRRALEQERNQARQEIGNLDERLKQLLMDKGLLEKEVKDRDQKVEELLAKLKNAELDNDKQTDKLKEAGLNNQMLLAKIKETERELDKQRLKLAGAESINELLATKLKDANQSIEKRTEEIAGIERQRDKLRDTTQGMEGRLKKLLGDVALLEKESKESKQRVEAMQANRLDTESGLKELRGKLATAERERAEALSKLNGLDSKATDSATALERVRGELEIMRRDADNRFAGIELTGKRVVFLVDMSGSMGYVKEDVPAPQKWSGVRETVVKIMRSLPALEKYQLLVFSDKQPIYLLGKPGEWLPFDVRKSPLEVSSALEKLRPEGGTNMYDAFRTAFEFRRSGLDTIYFFSDGLPNVGEGLTATESKTLNEIQKGERLGKFILKKLAEEWNVTVDRKKPVKINAIGFFFESPDLGAFLWTLARANDGGFVGMSKP